MAQTVGQHGVAAFTSPVNGDPLNATVVVANDNATRGAYVDHDNDPDIHVQSSLFASRPAAGTAGRKWLTTDPGSVKLWFDTGSAWSEIAYLPSAGGTVAGNVSITGTLGVTGVLTATGGVVGAVTGNASTATALQTARAINGVTFDGTAAITVTADAGTLTGATLASNVLASSLTSVGTLAALTVTAPITGSVTGSSGSTTGNAATATALQTGRAINGVTFDGTAPITVTAAAGTLSGATLAATVTASSLTSVGTLGSLTVTAPITGSVTGSSGSTTGNAATATALQTARTINGTSFDGTANVTVTAAAGTLTGATLSSGVTASSLTSVGTLGNLTVTNPITGSVTGSSGSSTGNAATATALATARAINGVNFDGTAAITVTAAAGTLSGATLASGVTASSLTSVGTLASLGVTGNLTVDTDTLFVDATNNRVGIGTASPTYRLDVENTGGSASALRVRGNDQANVRVRLENVGSGGRVFELVGGVNGVANNAFSLYDATAAATRLTVDAAGNVGIGTTAPERLLSLVQSSAAAEIGQFIANSAPSTTGNAASVFFGTWVGASTTNIYNAKISAINTDGPNAATALTFYTYNGSGSSAGVGERWRINHSGHFLAGTDAIYDIGASGANRPRNLFLSGAATLASLGVTGNLTVDTDTLFVDATNNRVGIGTTSPTNRLDVRGGGYFERSTNGTNGDVLSLTNQTVTSNNGCRVSLDAYNIGTVAIGVPSDSVSLALYVSNIERWRINSSGHFIAATDASFDIGASGANRPRNLFLSGNGTLGGTFAVTGAATIGGTLAVSGASVTISNAAPLFSAVAGTNGTAKFYATDGTNAVSLFLSGGVGFLGTESNASLVIRGNNTTALTISGANVTAAGTLAVTGAVTIGSGAVYTFGDIGFTNTGAGGNFGFFTSGTTSPTFFCDHRGTSNTGLWMWRNGSAAANTQMSLSATGGLAVTGAFGMNGKTPVVNVAAPTAAGATYGATEQTLLNDIRTRLINLGIYT